MEVFSGKILGVTERASYFLENLRLSSSPLFFVDIVIVTILFYGAFVFLKETRAMRILYGLLFLAILFTIGSFLHLVLLNWILQHLMTMLFVAIPVVFQPELRAALERVGRSKLFSERVLFRHDFSTVNSEVVAATRRLSEQKIGALIVIQRQTGLREYVENGIIVDAKVTSSLLVSIFFPRSPLHDGAVIITGDKIISARSTLPVSEVLMGRDLGMRHKAAVGITEDSDAVAIVVSEETGAVSLAVGGKMERKIQEDRLRNRLAALMRSVSR